MTFDPQRAIQKGLYAFEPAYADLRPQLLAGFHELKAKVPGLGIHIIAHIDEDTGSYNDCIYTKARGFYTIRVGNEGISANGHKGGPFTRFGNPGDLPAAVCERLLEMVARAAIRQGLQLSAAPVAGAADLRENGRPDRVAKSTPQAS